MKREYETAIRKIIELAKVIENGKNVMWVNGVLDKRLKGRLLTIGKILNQDAGTGDKSCNLQNINDSNATLDRCECEEPQEEPIKICLNCNGYIE